MRRLLLLLLTFLLPLQLLAATVGDVSTQRLVDQGCLSCDLSAPGAMSPQLIEVPDGAGQAGALDDPAPELPTAQQGTGQDDGDDDSDAPVLQADCDDHTLPALAATAPLSWHPFPHAFGAPLHWPSIDRAQLRPPPLA